MVGKILNKLRNEQNSAKKILSKHWKYQKPSCIQNEGAECQNRYEILHVDGNDEETENSSDIYTIHRTKHLKKTPKQVQVIIIEKKRLKVVST